MNQLELLLLLNEERARAAIAWPLVQRSPKPEPGLERAGPRSYYSAQEWMTLAGLQMVDHRGVALALFGAKLIDPSGTVDEVVVTYARRLLARELKRGHAK